MKRIKANDPFALSHAAMQYWHQGIYSSAFEFWTKAAEFGDVDAHYHLASMYSEGKSVERDLKKEVYHLEEASIGGHPHARYNLGKYAANVGKYERAVKHYAIAANLGHTESLESLKKGYKSGFVKKEDLAAALRAYQAAVDATKSPHREAEDRLINKAKW